MKAAIFSGSGFVYSWKYFLTEYCLYLRHLFHIIALETLVMKDAINRIKVTKNSHVDQDMSINLNMILIIMTCVQYFPFTILFFLSFILIL